MALGWPLGLQLLKFVSLLFQFFGIVKERVPDRAVELSCRQPPGAPGQRPVGRKLLVPLRRHAVTKKRNALGLATRGGPPELRRSTLQASSEWHCIREGRFGSPLKLARVHWVRPELVVEVTYLTWTGDNLLRQVSYQGQREDKPARQVVRSIAHPSR